MKAFGYALCGLGGFLVGWASPIALLGTLIAMIGMAFLCYADALPATEKGE